MGKEQHETGPQGELFCPVCKQHVDLIVKRRHKTLGAYVPVWGVGPCHNPDCPEYLEPHEHAEHTRQVDETARAERGEPQQNG